MDWILAVEAHKRWWDVNRLDELALFPAYGLFKALRNFVHQLLDAVQRPRIGADRRQRAAEAIGDMFMYLFSVSHAVGVAPVEPKHAAVIDVDMACAAVARSFAAVLTSAVERRSPRMPLLIACEAVADLAEACAVTVADALAASISKLESGRVS